MSEKLVMVKGGVELPQCSFLVFVFNKGSVKVIRSSDIVYLDDLQQEFVMHGISEDRYSVNVKRMELIFDNVLINNVRWFVAQQLGDGRFVIVPKKYTPRVSGVQYLASILTAGLLGCVFLKEKNVEAKCIAEHWDRTQKELCEWYAFGLLGKELHRLMGNYDFERIREIKRRHDVALSGVSENDLRIIERIGSRRRDWASLDRELEELSKYGDFGFVRDRLDFAKNVFQILGIDSAEQARELKEKYSMAVASVGAEPTSKPINARVEHMMVRLEEMCGAEFESVVSQLERLVVKYGRFGELESQLDKGKAVMNIFGDQSLEDIRNFKFRQEMLLESYKQQQMELEKMEKVKEESILMQKEWNDLIGTPDDRRIIRKLQSKYGGLTQLDRELELLSEHGKLSNVLEKLRSMSRVSTLENQIKLLEEREKRWQAVANGHSLEYVERIKEQSSAESKTNKGLEFEKEIEAILSEIDSYDTENNFDWKSQHDSGGSKADFLVVIRNKHGQELTVVMECKRWGKHDAEIGHLSSVHEEEAAKTKKDLVDKGIKQLCEYYDKNQANIGLLVTDFDIRTIGKPDLICSISNNDIPHKYRKDGMDLLMVSSSCFKTLMTIIRFAMHACRPNELISFDIERMEKLHNENNIQELFQVIVSWYQRGEKVFEKLMNKSETASKEINLLKKYINQYAQDRKAMQEQLEQKRIEHEYYSRKAPLSLEGTTPDAVLNEVVQESKVEFEDQ